MYKIKNSILTKDNKKIFALGQSYYPSFHHAKYPVPPEGDRIGEMKKDLKLMHEMGFNHVRFAAIGLTKLDEYGKLIIDTPLVDAMIEEAGKNDMSVSVRLEGYVVNLHDYKNILMIDNEGKEQDTSAWFDFIQTTLHHKGIRSDNIFHAKELAKYYSKYPNVVAYQIYNEPHYPGGSFFDYHPLAIEAYRKWLVAKGELSPEDAASYEPPRHRKEQSPHMWALWRIFSQDSLTEFLADASFAAKSVVDLPTYTCYTACQVSLTGVFRGVDYFKGAKAMDIPGYTCYIHGEGSDYYTMNLYMDMNTSAAKLTGKETWCIELDSRTKIPPRIYNKNTYAMVGSGAKGIVYYQWRGDYPSEATPIPNGCGLVNYDGTKTPNYDNAAQMNALLNRLSNYIVNADPISYGIGILHSDYACYYCDAEENNDEKRMETCRNSYIIDLLHIYRDIRKAGLSTTITTADFLKENPTGLKYLFVPKAACLSLAEKEAIEAFVENGGIAYELNTQAFSRNCIRGYYPYGKKTSLYVPYMELEDVISLHQLTPIVTTDSYQVAVQVLQGKGYLLLALTNISCHLKNAAPTLFCNFEFRSAVLYTSKQEPIQLKTDGKIIYVESIEDGGFVLIK